MVTRRTFGRGAFRHPRASATATSAAEVDQNERPLLRARPASFVGRLIDMPWTRSLVRHLAILGTLTTAASALALPVQLNDENGTRYFVNTQVDPVENVSNASGALTDATYVKAVTVTSTFIGFT